MESIDLVREGYPNYELFSDGTVVNKKTGNPVKPTYGRYVSLWKNNKDKLFSIAVLLRRYFHNELKELPMDQVKNLAFLGYPGYSVTFDGRIWTHRTENWMYPAANQNGYVEVKLTDHHGRVKDFKLHRLIALAFVPNPNNCEQVDHIDGNKLHNAATNLQWVTNLENNRKARELGLKPMAITDAGVHKACQMILDGYTDTEIANVVGTYSAIIYHIRTGHTHCEISSQYGIKENRIRGRKIDWSKYPKLQKNHKRYIPKKDFIVNDLPERYTRKGVDA